MSECLQMGESKDLEKVCVAREGRENEGGSTGGGGLLTLCSGHFGVSKGFGLYHVGNKKPLKSVM